MKGQEENSAFWGPDSILCLDLDSVYSRVYFLIILLTEYIYWLGFPISISPFKILRIFLIEKMKEQQILCLAFCPFFISHPTWIEVLLKRLWYTVRTFSMGTLHSLQSRMKTNTSSETYMSSLQDSVPHLPTSTSVPVSWLFTGTAGRAWLAMFANFCGVNISTEADFKLQMWCHLWAGRT